MRSLVHINSQVRWVLYCLESHYCRVYLAFIAGSSIEQTLSLLKLKIPSSHLKWGFRKNWEL